MTIVKVQRPALNSGPHQMWLIYDQLKARVEHCPMSELPQSLRDFMDKARGNPKYMRVYVDDVFWDEVHHRWIFTKYKITHDRRW